MPPTTTEQLATELRDTLLQDLVAIQLMLRYAQVRAADATSRVLHDAESVLSKDLDQLRHVISRLGPPA